MYNVHVFILSIWHRVEHYVCVGVAACAQVQRMARPVVRIPLDVPPEMAEAIDRAVGYLHIESGQRQTRTSFIKQAIQIEVERLSSIYAPMSAKKAPSKRVD